MGLKTRDEMRRALRPAAQAMSCAISRLRDLGQEDVADELKEVFETWVSTGNRGVRRASPRGRVVVKPIGEFSAARPPVGVEEWARYVPMLRAQHAARAKPLRLVPTREVVQRLRRAAEQEAEVLDAG